MELFSSEIESRLHSNNDNPFFILNVNDIRTKIKKWKQTIPRAIPYYAVKCNDNELVLKVLAENGTGFDCASKNEISKVLKLGVDCEKIIYSNTVKQISHLKYAAKMMVQKVTFDSVEELEKIKAFHPNAQVVLRIRFDSNNSIVNLGTKFGCDPVKTAPKLIELCQKMNMNLIGLHFHVGSWNRNYEIFTQALATIRKLFNFAETCSIKLNFIDIGGGFIGEDLLLLDLYAKSINAGINDNFPSDKIKIISEPGRFFVDSAFKLVTQIILKKLDEEDGRIHYYLNESIYMSFMATFLYNLKPLTSVIKRSKGKNDFAEEKLSTIWGCSCNSNDKIVDNVMLREMEMGDWLVFHNMGAYTLSVSTKFNGFQNNEVLVIDEERQTEY
ncbi:hypothetical protein PVAND_007188 [Polypedilum vanderplanki]|uniref:ornithine decarboxylase n=1 Tax=Polypedilum vanderplanki TaxID=319348 RepID=A0A9J6C730_POLVA|nr:hypothetical protein PVAND_007188 [Polypedilum vanderplanki]